MGFLDILFFLDGKDEGKVSTGGCFFFCLTPFCDSWILPLLGTLELVSGVSWGEVRFVDSLRKMTGLPSLKLTVRL